MQSLHIAITNGYGITKFDATLPFDRTQEHPRQDTNLVYAQNGTMKSSLAHTLYDYSQDIKIKDHIFDLPGNCSITDDSGATFPTSDIISIPSFDSAPFNCERMSSLMVNETLRQEYDGLMEKYNKAYEVFVTRLKRVSGISSRAATDELPSIVCPELDKGAEASPEMLISLVRSARSQIEQQPEFIQHLPYTIAGSSDAQKFAKENEGDISELMKAYNELKESASFVRGEFDTSSAQKLVKEIEKSKFFSASHDLELLNSSTNTYEKVTTIDDLREKLATDIDIVLQKYSGLKTKFNKMIADLSTGTRADLKKLLEGEETREIITIMNDARIYKRRLWWGYLKGCLDEFNALEAVGAQIQARLVEIVEQAKKEATDWDHVVEKFNHRFRNLPYSIAVEDKSNVILKDKAPELVLSYKHPLHDEKYFRTPEERDGILLKLSTGERKAFYLLNVMFEIETAQKSGKEHLIVLDDIVDSFDYKNKYAFLEYLYDVSTNYDQIKLVILTHNFDFFRLLQQRLFGGFRSHTWIAQKLGNDIVLGNDAQFNVIKDTKDKAPADSVMWLALIPFARNLIEYRCQSITAEPDYQTLTDCLHELDNAHNIHEIQTILNNELGVMSSPINLSNDFETELFKAADSINASSDTPIVIQRNLLLAIASRRLAEKYMKSKLVQADIDTAKNMHNKFTRSLFNIYVDKATPSEEERISIDRVNLMTPEHIHVNSFMYEPLVDLSLDELRDLYRDMKNLNNL